MRSMSGVQGTSERLNAKGDHKVGKEIVWAKLWSHWRKLWKPCPRLPITQNLCVTPANSFTLYHQELFLHLNFQHILSALKSPRIPCKSYFPKTRSIYKVCTTNSGVDSITL